MHQWTITILRSFDCVPVIPLSREHQYSRTYFQLEKEREESCSCFFKQNSRHFFSEGSIHEISNQKYLLQSWINSNHIYGNLIRVVLSDESTNLVVRTLHLHGFCPGSNTLPYHTGDFLSLAFLEQPCVTIPKLRVDWDNKEGVWFKICGQKRELKKNNNQKCGLQVPPHRMFSKWHNMSCSI